jgi:hypothetical protein
VGRTRHRGHAAATQRGVHTSSGRLSDRQELTGDRSEGAIALTNLKQRRRERRRKLVYVNPDLLGALRALAKDAGVPSTGLFLPLAAEPWGSG